MILPQVHLARALALRSIPARSHPGTSHTRMGGDDPDAPSKPGNPITSQPPDSQATWPP